MKKLLLAAALSASVGVANAYDVGGIDITLGQTQLGGAFDQSLIYTDINNDGEISVNDGEVSFTGYGYISSLFVGADINNSFDCDVFSVGGQCEIAFSFGGLVLESIDTSGGDVNLDFNADAGYLNFYLLDASSTSVPMDVAFNSYSAATQSIVESGNLYFETTSNENFFATQIAGTQQASTSASSTLNVSSHAGAGWYFDTNQFGDPAEPYDIQLSSTINQNGTGPLDQVVTYFGNEIELATFAGGVITFDAVVSEPGTLAILGSLLVGAGFAARRRKA